MNEHDTPIRRRRLLDAGQHQPLLDAYGRHLVGAGLSPVSVHIHLGSALHFLTWLVQSGISLDDVWPGIVARFAAHDCRCHSSPRLVGQYYIARVGRFVCHVSARGVVRPEPVAETPALDRNVADWLNAQARQRGLAKVTILRHGRMLAQILPLIGLDPSRYTARIIRDGLLDHVRSARSVHYPRWWRARYGSICATWPIAGSLCQTSTGGAVGLWRRPGGWRACRAICSQTPSSG